MIDIAMCKNLNCPIKESCYRFIAIPDDQYQSYSDFKYDFVTGNCEYFWRVEK